ncbi:MAG: hypothetical protein ACOC3Z_03585 [Nanoarchaeota archaeon]
MGNLKIFAVYLNVDNFSQQGVIEMVNEYYAYFNRSYNHYPEIKIHIFPVYNQETKIECIYPPTHVNKSESDIIKIYQLLLQEKNGEAVEKMKMLERKLKIYKITNKDEHKNI